MTTSVFGGTLNLAQFCLSCVAVANFVPEDQ